LISSILATSSSRILINGQPGRSISHARRLRQDDPLSPMLFILAIDPLQLMLVLPKTANLRWSLYGVDAAIFADASSSELKHLQKIIHIFGDCPGLRINMSKTEIYTICLNTDTVQSLIRNFLGKICSFPVKYLGLPLHSRKLRKVDVQPLINKIGNHLPDWKGKMLSLPRRETLVKTVLSSQPICHLSLPSTKVVAKKN